MKSYILRAVEPTLRQRLIDSGVTFYDWNTDIIVDHTQYGPSLKALNAEGIERETEYENISEVTLTYNSAVPVQPARVERAPMSEQEAERARSRAAYIQACSARFKEGITCATNDFDSRVKKLRPVVPIFAKLSRQDYVASYRADEAERSARWASEFKRLFEVPNVNTVRVTTDHILLYTDMIFATKFGSNQKYELGQFLIVIRTDGAGEPIQWFNQTRRVGGVRPIMNAPYVLSSGAPLLSEMQETFIQLIAQLELCVVAEIAIQFLETVEDNEAGRHIDKWPRAQV